MWLALLPFILAGPTDARAPAFSARPGSMDLSGQLIVRPIQPEILAAQGMDPTAAELHHARAVARLTPLVLKSYTEVDEYVVTLPPGLDERTFASRLLATGEYQYAHPNWLVHPSGQPDDPRFGDQWHHAILQSALAWNITTGEPAFITAFCDTGIDHTHPDLAPHLVPGFNAVTDLAEADGGDTSDVNGHGTHISGCAAAVGNNGIGIAGANWNSRIMMARVTDDPGGAALLDDILQAARWAADHGAGSISTSYPGVESEAVETTGAYCRARGALYFYAAPGDGANHSEFDWPDVIVVGASDKSDHRANFSAYGKSIDVFAPGIDILSTAKGGGYESWSGVSPATAIASGVCALIRSANPSLTPAETETILEQACDDMGAPGEDDLYGWGRINSYRAVTLAAPCYPDFTGDGTLDLFDFLSFVNAFNAEDPAADCTTDGILDLFDFLCFVNTFNQGC